jgi:hypothetical protein
MLRGTFIKSGMMFIFIINRENMLQDTPPLAFYFYILACLYSYTKIRTTGGEGINIDKERVMILIVCLEPIPAVN